ncbi:NAD(P)-binding protein [Antribacter gilvus]|uniref:NAD(P)-binding protein n=1 Tax=Antribacter gilvus TaxID=2304675 RepID=UPI000F797047
MAEASTANHEVVVVGGGQAGLAISYYLTRSDVKHLVLEAAGQPGASWTNRWDSLRLFTARRLQRAARPPVPRPGRPVPERP